MKHAAARSLYISIAFVLAIAVPATLVGGTPSHYLGAIPGEPQPELSGIALAEVRPLSPADKAGLETGDVVTQIGEVNTPTVEQFYDALRAAAPGVPTPVIYYRDGVKTETDVVLQARRSG